MIKPLVSVIVPCYNQGKFLSETLDSVLNQTYENWECIVIDDGSVDDTSKVGMEYSKMDKRITYHYQVNSGVSAARNNAINMSKGEFILPLDADDLISSTYMEKAMNYFEEYPETKLVYSRASKFGLVNAEWFLPEYKYEEFIWKNCIFNASFFRRCDYDQISGGFNEKMKKGYEDWEFFLSLLDATASVHRINEILFHYRIHSVSRNRAIEKDPYDTLVTMASLHPEIYKKYWNQIVAIKEAYNKLAADEYYFRNSLAYKIGFAILTPYRKVKTIISALKRFL